MKLPRYNMETFDGRAWYAPVERENGWWVQASDAEAIINKLKCCGNCKHNFAADEEKCQGCCEPKLEKWEMRE
jgi:hypothetical protein